MARSYKKNVVKIQITGPRNSMGCLPWINANHAVIYKHGMWRNEMEKHPFPLKQTRTRPLFFFFLSLETCGGVRSNTGPDKRDA